MTSDATALCGQDGELLGKGWGRIVGKPRLSFAHHGDHLDAGKDDAGRDRGLEAEHRPDAALDPSMILLDPVVQIFAVADQDRGPGSRSPGCQAMRRITLDNGFPIGLAAVNDDAIRPAVASESLSDEALCRQKIPMFAETELDGVANAVNGAVEIHPLAPDLDVGFVHMPFPGYRPLAQVEALQQCGRKANDPAVE